ncbi:MAG: META domain-containing protein [candidate division NC10 bacterium]
MARGSSYLVAAWRLLRFDPGTGSLTHPVRGTELTADFRDDGRLAGSVGGNRYTPTYEARGSSLTVNPQSAATRTRCGNPEGAMAQEDALLQVWGRVIAYGIHRDRLRLADSEEAPVIVFALAETSERTSD